MLRKVMTIATLFAVVAVAANAQAGPIDFLFDVPQVNVLQDQDWESLLDKTTLAPKALTDVGAGDIFVGVFLIDTVNGFSDSAMGFGGAGTSAAFTGILVAKVKAAPVGGVVEFEALTNAEYSALQGAYGGLPGRVDSNSAILVYQKAEESNFATFPNGYINPTTINSGFTSASTHSTAGTVIKTLELGFVDDTYAAAKLTPTGFTKLEFALALNVTSNPLDLQFGKITTPISLMTQVDGTTFLPAANFHIAGAANTAGSGGFQFQTNADMKFVMPEPGSLTLLGLGALGLFGARLRRRKTA